jgi:hypothetical protein
MKKLILLLMLGIPMAIFAQAEKKQNKVSVRNLSNFNSIEVSDALSLDIKNGDTHTLQLEFTEGFEEYIKSEVEGSVLKISIDKRIKEPKQLKLTVTTPEIVSIQLFGASQIKSKDTLRTDNLEIKLSDAANANLVLVVQNLKTEISGAGNLSLSGYATNHMSTISGAGDLKAFNLVSEKINLNVTGAGDAQVNATKELQIKASGAGDVIYVNEPENLIAEVTGAGEVRKKSTTSFEQNSDTTRLRLGDIKIVIIDESKAKGSNENKESEKKSSGSQTNNKKHQKIGHWAGLDFGVNAFTTYDYSFKMAPFNQHLELDMGKCFNVAFNFAQWELPIVKNHVSVVSGLGLEWQKYAFKNNTTILPDKNKHIGFIDTLISYDYSLFKTSWLNVPLLLALNSNKNLKKSFHIAAGVVLGYNYTQKTKTRYKIESGDFENVTKGDFALEPFKYAATVRLGYGNFNVFASYQLNNMFKKGAGPELFPVTAGITLIGF